MITKVAEKGFYSIKAKGFDRDLPKFPRIVKYPFAVYTQSDNTLNNCEVEFLDDSISFFEILKTTTGEPRIVDGFWYS